METQELEKILKRLEKLDIQEWEIHRWTTDRESINVKTNGIEFYLEKEDMPPFKSTYSLSIKNIEDDIRLINYSTSQIEKASKSLIKDFYEKTSAQIKEYKTKTLKEKLNSFVSE